jgi:hypothetical protein
MATLDHPYAGAAAEPRWLRGNLHCHSTRSDGKRTPQAVIDDYAVRGYDFLMFSDHDVWAGPAELAGLDARTLALIPGHEVTKDGPHLLQVGGRTKAEAREDRQAVIDDVIAAGGFAVVNHPNWFEQFDHCPHAVMRGWKGFAGVEIYNHVITRMPGSPYATDHWDRLLSQGRRVWGFANDDAHEDGEAGFGWNMVLGASRDSDAIVAAMARGRFYASTGVAIESIAVEGMRVTVRTRDAERIAAMGTHGRRLKVVDAAELSFEVPEREIYVRFQCWGRGERQAWTQPFFVAT